MKKPELLIPAKGPEELKTAVHFGADAVYIGGEAFSLRAKAKNFSPEEMGEGILFAHENGVKVYITANILAHNKDLTAAEEYFRELGKLKPDALILSDPGMFRIAERVCPEIDRHISTQANNTNFETFLFWRELGAKRVVAARELTLAELKEIRENLPADMEIEAFVHGAMCISYSGRCLISAYMTGRSANSGECTHPCRWNYAVAEESRPGEYFPVCENERGTFLFSSKDLCMIEHIPELIQAGIDSFKVEGRMKPALYTAVTTGVYRAAIDDFLEDPLLYQQHLPRYREEIARCTLRETFTGFYFGKPSDGGQILTGDAYRREAVYLGIVDEVYEDGSFGLYQMNEFEVGEDIEVIGPGSRTEKCKVQSILNEKGESVPDAPHPKEHLRVRLSAVPRKMDILRR